MRIFFDYIKFCLSAKPAVGHGIHSPFVYDFSVKVLYNDDNKAVAEIENLRRQLLKNKKSFVHHDLALGKDHKKKISGFVKKAAMPSKYGRILFRLTNYFNSSQIIELGTGSGLSAAYLSMGNKKARLITLEACPELAKIASENLNALGLKQVDVVVGEFSEKIKHFEIDYSQPVIVFVDGNHKFNPTIEYFNFFIKSCHEDSVLIFDDIYWSKEMKQAWQYIKAQSRVPLTIDIFRMGMVFMRSGIVKQDFKIRL